MRRLRSKLQKIEGLDERCEIMRNLGMGATIVFTNGCFDLLHIGHVHFLESARSLGDVLIVGVNDDASIRLLKGPARPILPLESRMEMLAALEAVDIVVPMCSTRNTALLQLIAPAVWAKGGDYTRETLDKSEVAMADLVGTKIEILPFLPGISTSQLIAKISS